MTPPKTSTPPVIASHPPKAEKAPSPEKTLRRLFLTLFLRGRSSRGLRRESAPRSVGSKLALTLSFYALFGMFALVLVRQPVFALSVYLHGMTFVFLGMFVAASAGEVLFNKEEADILMHRPVAPRSLLWAKVRVLVEVSLWLAAAFNLAGLVGGVFTRDGGLLFPLAHAVSTVMEALFCTGCVVLVYQLCLRWFGRERLEGLMTTAQVLISIAAVMGGQIVPRVMLRVEGVVTLNAKTWWVGLLPPAWFAGFDDALAGSRTAGSWVLAGAGLLATALVLWLAFGKLARDYQAGVQALSETVSKKRPVRARRRWLDVLASSRPLRWWLREPIPRGTFLLTSAYLFRDRDVKLRVYPSLAPMLVMPFIFLFQGGSKDGFGGGFGVAFCSAYAGLIPMYGLEILRYSQQWQAADVFRAAPMTGPMPLCDGARKAVLIFLTLPLLLMFGALVMVICRSVTELSLLLPGILAIPVYALIPSFRSQPVPLSCPTEEAKSAGRGMFMVGVMFVSMIVSGIAFWAWHAGWFWWLILAETILVICLYAGMKARLKGVKWDPMD